MSRPLTSRCFILVRNFNSGTSTRNFGEADNLTNQLLVLSTRGHVKQAISLFYTAPPALHTKQAYGTLFHGCAIHGNLKEGQQLHKFMVSHASTNEHDLFVSNHLVNMYAKCGCMDRAHKMFDEMPQRNIVSWTALITGYSQSGYSDECFRLFSAMLRYFRPNEFSFASVLSSCCYKDGRQVHALAEKMCVFVGNALIKMYSKSHGGCSDGINEARAVFETMEFRNIVSWNSMISGLQFHELGLQALDLFREMHINGIGFDRVTLLSVLPSLCLGNDVDVGACLNNCKQLHSLSVKTALFLNIEVATAFVKAYSDNGGQAGDCYKLFSESSCYRDVVSWTGIITAFSERDPPEAIFLFKQLHCENLAPDWCTFSIVLKACAGLVTPRPALTIHSQVIKNGFHNDTVIGNSLIHAYARCGLISSSKQVFTEMEFRDLVSWNSILKVHALFGEAKEALQLFSYMNVQPDSATIVALLSACSHGGLVKEAIDIFDSMSENHGIAPQLDHYACMVDVFGRAGRIFEAMNLIQRMPMEPDSVIWSALLGSCRKHGEDHIAKLASLKLKELDPENSLGYIQISNIYCSGGSFNKAREIRKEMNSTGVRKEPGLSWTEVGTQVHEFASGGRCHPQRNAICAELDKLIAKLKCFGYVPETSLALHDIEEEQKEEHLYYHSEKLALVFAIMNQGSLCTGERVIRITKNIRICVDCHNFMKLASDLLQNDIVVRDSNRFHHFSARLCSCNDYW